MAGYSNIGEECLLESMFIPFLTSQEDSSETDLKKYLSNQSDDFVNETEDDVKAPDADEYPLEVLFARDSALTSGPDDQPLLAPLSTEKKSIDTSYKNENTERCKFHLAHNENYRTFMEEVMLVKCCSKKMLQLLEDAKVVLEHYVEIKNDPGFGRVPATLAWTWVLKEAMSTALLTMQKDREKTKHLTSFCKKALLNIQQCFRQLLIDSKNLKITFDKVWKEVGALANKALERFSNNLQGSFNYEMKMSGYNFFFHRTDSEDSLTEIRDGMSEKGAGSLKTLKPSETSQKHSLQIRCSIDGVTLRTGNLGSSWLKFQKIDHERDIFLLLNIFVSKMTEHCATARKTMALVNEILEVHMLSIEQSDFNDSILESVQRCQMILNRSKWEARFYPKEEVIMLFSLKSMKAAFELTLPLLTEFALIIDRQFTIVTELAKQRKQLKNGLITRRFPASLNVHFELFIEDTNIDTDVILNRYPNVRDAKELKEKLLQKYSKAGGLPEFNEMCKDIPVDVLFKRESKLFLAPSTQEMIDMFRNLITQEVDVANPNPAHYLISDVQQEYIALTKELTTTRMITPAMLELCSDPIQKFYQEAVHLSSTKDKMLTQLVYATQKLTYTQSGRIEKTEKCIPMSSWIQIMCKTVNIWNFHALPKHFQTHFRAKNEMTMKWIAKLEYALKEFNKLLKEYKEELDRYHEFIEANHGFITWVRREFQFNPPNEIVSKWSEESQEDEESTGDLLRQASSKNVLSGYQLQFQDFDMSFVQTNPTGETITLFDLNKISGNAQIGVVTSIFNFIDEIVSSAIINLNYARSIQEKYITVKPLKNAIPSDRKLTCLNNIHQLEDLVLALSFEMTRKDFKETVAYVGFLNEAISHLNRMFQTVQLHMENKEILQVDKQLSTGSAKGKIRYSTKDHLNHDRYLNETVQLLASSVEAMPNIFEIQAEEVVDSFTAWANLAEKDAKLMDTWNPTDHDESSAVFEVSTLEEEEMEAEAGSDADSVWPIYFDEAMMLTGKSFFPDPSLFPIGIESWRDVCFKMLAAALAKFGELTTSKINETRITLTSPYLSQASTLQPAAKITSVGYSEGLCSLLCFITRQLSSRDRPFVSRSDLKLFKSKLANIGSVLEKFKKSLDATEKVLVNSLSLAMATIEHKRLPRHLPVLPREHDFLKSHDLDEVGSRMSLTTAEDTKAENVSLKSLGPSGNNLVVDALIDEGAFVELQWDSSHKSKVFCRTCGPHDSNWLQFIHLHITGQLHLIHLVIDELTREFEKATELIREAKLDLTRAKNFLEKTWKGIGKDCKIKRMPGSGVLVLLKLFRHHVATAVINLKTIRKTFGEVKYLLSESTQSVNLWIHEKEINDYTKFKKRTNYIMNLSNLSLNVKLKASSPAATWLLKDEEKVAEQEINQPTAVDQVPKALEEENFSEIKGATYIKSSYSIVQNDVSSVDIDSSLAAAKTSNSTGTTFKEKGLKRPGHGNFSAAATLIQQLILSELTQSVAILKLPNCAVQNPSQSTESQEIMHIIGVVTALMGVTVDIRFFKDIMPAPRKEILTRIALVQEKLNQIQNDGSRLLKEINSECKKIKETVQLLDVSIRSKCSVDGEYPPMEENLIAPVQPLCRVTPTEFVERYATSIHGHVWTVACGIPNLGTVIKNNKTLESHVVPNISLPSKLEVWLSIVGYLGNIMSHVHTNLKSSKNDIASAKSLLRSKTKDIATKNFVKRAFGMLWNMEDVVMNMSKGEVTNHLNNLARIANACVKAHEHLSLITDLLQRVDENLQLVTAYMNLKFKMEPIVGAPRVDNDILMKSQNWQTVDTISGVADPPKVPPPVLLKKIARKSQRQDSIQFKYKNAWEHKILELETYFEQLCDRNNISVDIPIAFVPLSGSSSEASQQNYEIL